MSENNSQNFSNKKRRSPVVVVLGHVDHGKTTLLDYLRKTNLASKESGGITQSIGAYEVDYKGNLLTFIDTPGHEAFSKMRSRGAAVADLAILVVAADEGVKPQTKEAIKILQETETPYVVAITKIDKPTANLERVKQDLLSNDVLLEGLGGNISYEPISAKTGQNIDKLLELILLTAEMEDLTYNPENPARGVVIEVSHSKNRGIETSVIVKDGILRSGDFIATPSASGKILILENFLNKKISEIKPSSPALIVGFEKAPSVGEEFQAGAKDLLAVDNDFESKNVRIMPDNNSIFEVPDKNQKTNLILKSAENGSLEVLSQVIKNLPQAKSFNIILEDIGEITSSDIDLASSANAIIINFRSKLPSLTLRLAQNKNVKIISSDVIYKLIEDLQNSLQPVTKEKGGELEVLAVFNQSNPEKQTIGGKVIKGAVKNKSSFELERDKTIISFGKVLNVQVNKKDVPVANFGSECGLMVSSKILIKIGDHLLFK